MRSGFFAMAAILAVGIGCLPIAGNAAVTSSGQVTPTDVVSTPVQISTELRIGDDILGDFEDGDPRASVTVNGGDLLDFHQAFVGYDVGFFGRLEASGTGTLVRLRDGGANDDAALEVGRQGNGYASFTNGAKLDLDSSSADLVIASDAGSIGEMLVDTGAFVDLDDDILVGDAGAGRLLISGGSLVRTTDTTSDVNIGDKVTGSGYLSIDGHLTTLQLGGNLNVGRLGIGEMVISNQALVDANNTGSQAAISALGKVRMQGGVLDVRDVNVDGYLGGYGTVRGQVDVNASGDVEADAGHLLNFEDAFNNSGAVTITNGEIRLLDTATTTATGRYALEDGTVRFSSAHTNNGVIASAEGTNNIHGAITNNGTTVVASESVAVFNDSYTDAGTTTVLARGNALFLSDLTFTSAAFLSLALSEEDGDNNSAQVEVAGAATLGGQLDINFDGNFVPTFSRSFSLLYADGGITGQFLPPVFPNIQGVDFGILYGANNVTLNINVDQQNFLDGDFNEDGIVDAVDYAVWREGLGTIYGQQDYLAWRQNYGQTSIQPAVAEGAVPSPGSLLCLAVAAGQLLVRRGRR